MFILQEGDVEMEVLPRTIGEVDAAFMTRVLRHAGVISAFDEVVSKGEGDVGMTAGYFSAIKKVKCTYKHAKDARHAFVVKTWPSFEILPKEAIAAMFLKDFRAYSFPPTHFYPHPKAYLAAFDLGSTRCALVMEDADVFAEHKVHERELNVDEVLTMIPKLG